MPGSGILQSMKTKYEADLTISERGQLVIPKATRMRLGFTSKSKIHMIESNGAVTLKPKPDLEALDKACEELRGKGRGRLEKFGFKSVDDYIAASRGR